jgi:hypothetical protein
MPQIFSPAADTWLKIFFVAALCSIAGIFVIAGGYVRSDYLTGKGWVLNQPIPFSHEHHVSGLGIDCQYCHNTVETSADAGIPPTYTCMTCHSQIWTGALMLEPLRQSLAKGIPLHWNRVAKLPDYVYFNHSVHIRAGVGCVTCHGQVDRMPLMQRAQPFEMQWCISCHRDPAPNLRPRASVTDMNWSTNEDRRELGHKLMAEYGIDPKRLTDCYTCHR